MRDTLALRTRIALLTCVPGAIACNPPPRPQPVDQDDKSQRSARGESRVRDRSNTQLGGSPTPRVGDKRKEYYAKKAKEEGKTVEEVTPPAQLEAERKDALLARRRKALERRRQAKQNATSGDAPRPQPRPSRTRHTESPDGRAPQSVPGDPPFIDGYNPEEEQCTSGNWCGTITAAAAIGIEGVEEQLGCPSRIGGGTSREAIEANPKAYKGLSSASNMQGGFNEHGTELARTRSGNDQTCCYHWFNYCSGRPHRASHGPIVAPLEPGGAWDGASRATASVQPSDLEASLRQQIAAQWHDDALAEHASVAAFARATLELMAVGAPPQLLAEAQQAGLDEIDHARRCFSLARHYGAETMQPGPLPALGPRPSTLTQLAVDTFVEGCVGETIAALVAQRAARDAAPEVAEHLMHIADDEARHAALAWSTIAWALRQGGADVVEAIRRAADPLRSSSHDSIRTPPDPHAAQWRAHGRLDPHARAQAAQHAWTDVIEPMLEQTLRDAVPPLA